MSKKKKNKQEVPVLYQNLGGRWYAFTEVEGEVFIGKIKNKAPNTRLQQKAGTETKGSKKKDKEKSA